jgi:sugar lactone lactonase YvrE
VARIAASSALLAALLAAAAGAQSRPPPPVRPAYPFDVIPVDAVRGHLLEGSFLEPLGVAFDAEARELLVADSKNGLVGIFDARGVPLFTFGGPNLLTDPRRLAVGAGGVIHVLDSTQTVIRRFSYRGEPLDPFVPAYPALGDEPGGSARVTCFALGADGSLAAGDGERPQVLLYGPDGAFRLAIRPAKAAARFEAISDVALSRDGLLAVTDLKATPVQVFDRDGRFLHGFGGRDIAREDFSAPVSIEFDEDGRLFVVDMLRHDVKVFDVDGAFTGQFGGWYSPESRGARPGEMLYPTDIAIAPGGLVYVAERFGNRVQLFRREPKVPGEERPRLPIPDVRPPR